MQKVLIVPGFLGYKEEIQFLDLQLKLVNKKVNVEVIDWVGLPFELSKYLLSH